MGYINPIRQRLSEGKPVLNGWIAAPSALGAEAMAVAGWDAVTIDLQHGTGDYADLLTVFPAIEKSGAAPMVRVPWLDEGAIMRALDAGAMGIIAPMIETPGQAEVLVRSCLYPPEGARSFGPVRARYAWPEAYASVAAANREIVSLAMIETKKSVAALDEILAVPGLSGIYIGPGDLALSHGYTPVFDSEEPEIVGFIEHIRAKTAEAGLICGLHCGTSAYAARAVAGGMDLVTVGSDARFIEATARGVVSGFKDLTKCTPG